MKRTTVSLALVATLVYSSFVVARSVHKDWFLDWTNPYYYIGTQTDQSLYVIACNVNAFEDMCSTSVYLPLSCESGIDTPIDAFSGSKNHSMHLQCLGKVQTDPERIYEYNLYSAESERKNINSTMQAGTQLTLKTSKDSGRSINITFSLMGFTEAWELMMYDTFRPVNVIGGPSVTPNWSSGRSTKISESRSPSDSNSESTIYQSPSRSNTPSRSNSPFTFNPTSKTNSACPGNCFSEQASCIAGCSGDGQCVELCAVGLARCLSRCN